MTKHTTIIAEPVRGVFSSEESRIVRDMVAAGHIYRDIAARLNRTAGSVSDHARNMRDKAAMARQRRTPKPVEPEAAPEDTSLTGRLRASTYATRAQIAAERGWTTAQVQQRYHRAMAGEVV